MGECKKLSIIVPAIRFNNWKKLYDSIVVDFPWEIIFISPYYPDLTNNNVKFIRDFGSPVRASCLGANIAEGEYITWAADDGVFFSDTLKKSVALLDNDRNDKLVILTKYLEACQVPHPDWYYQLNIAYPKTAYIPDEWLIFNCGIMRRSYYEYIGGWDCCFETCALSHADLAARAQRDGCTTVLVQEPLLDCGHQPGASGDHGPIYHAHTEHDAPLYTQIYSSPDCVNRTKIDINNWKKASSIWRRRF